MQSKSNAVSEGLGNLPSEPKHKKQNKRKLCMWFPLPPRDRQDMRFVLPFSCGTGTFGTIYFTLRRKYWPHEEEEMHRIPVMDDTSLLISIRMYFSVVILPPVVLTSISRHPIPGPG